MEETSSNRDEDETESRAIHVCDRNELSKVTEDLRAREPEAAFISVLTWNILADVNLQSCIGVAGFYDDCDPEALPWHARAPLICALLASSGADVILLQEVERGAFEADLAPALAELGYSGRLETPAQINGGVLVREIPSCATFFRDSLFELAFEQESYRSLTLGLALRCGPWAGRRVAVANSHLEGHPDRSAARRSQMASVLRRLERRAWGFLVLGGDLNAGASAPVCAEDLRLQGGLRDVLDDRPERDATCFVGAHPAAHPDTSRVDHIFFDPRQTTLRASARVMSASWDRDARVAAGLPSADWPSDHLSVGAVLQLRAPRRGAPTVDELLARAPLAEAQLREWRALVEAEALQRAEAEAARRGHGRKARKGKPSKEEIAEMQALVKPLRDRRERFMVGIDAACADFLKRVETQMRQELKERS